MANLFKIIFFVFLISSEWASYQPKDLSFQVKFPENYNTVIDTISTELGDLEINHVYHLCQEEAYCTHKDPYSLYSLIYIQYPKNTFHKDSTQIMEELFQETINQRLTEMNGVLDYQSELERENYQGKLLRISNDKDQICKAKLMIVEDRFIAMQVVTSKSKSTNNRVSSFLNSFRIIED